MHLTFPKLESAYGQRLVNLSAGTVRLEKLSSLIYKVNARDGTTFIFSYHRILAKQNHNTNQNYRLGTCRTHIHELVLYSSGTKPIAQSSHTSCRLHSQVLQNSTGKNRVGINSAILQGLPSLTKNDQNTIQKECPLQQVAAPSHRHNKVSNQQGMSCPS